MSTHAPLDAELPIDVTVDDPEPSSIPLVPARIKGAPKTGDILSGKYRLESLVAEGGMGFVFAATDLQLCRSVAIKFIRPELMHDARLVERFVNEARAAARLRSEHVARVLDAGSTARGVPYFVMELLSGETLADLIDRAGPLPVGDAVDYVLQACTALAEAHSLGIIHRDVKAQNLVLTRQPDGGIVLKVLDFGIAKVRFASGQATLTQGTASMGSPCYMSPEQMRTPHDVDARTDIWSLGVVLYEMLTGDAPFDGNTTPEICANVLTLEPRPVREARPDVPELLEVAVLCCLEKDRDARFSSIAELVAAIEPFADAGAPVSAPSRSRGGRRRSSAPAAWALEPSAPSGAPRSRLGRVAVGIAVAAGMAGAATLAISPDVARVAAPFIAPIPHLVPTLGEAEAAVDDERSYGTMPLRLPLIAPDTTTVDSTPRTTAPLRSDGAVGTAPSKATTSPKPRPLDAEARRERYRAWLESEGLEPLPGSDAVLNQKTAEAMEEPALSRDAKKPTDPREQDEGAAAPDERTR